MFAADVLMPARLVREEQHVRCDRDFFRPCETFGDSVQQWGDAYTRWLS